MPFRLFNLLNSSMSSISIVSSMGALGIGTSGSFSPVSLALKMGSSSVWVFGRFIIPLIPENDLDTAEVIPFATEDDSFMVADAALRRFNSLPLSRTW